jgi:hypothetical protein
MIRTKRGTALRRRVLGSERGRLQTTWPPRPPAPALGRTLSVGFARRGTSSKERSMSISSSERSSHSVARLARAGADPRNGDPATTPGRSLPESNRRPRAVPDLPQELDDRNWDDLVAREVRHQEIIEASFDRADAYARLGDFEHALEWLDRAATVSGGLPPGYCAQRKRWDRTRVVRPMRTGGDRKMHLARAGAGAGR